MNDIDIRMLDDAPSLEQVRNAVQWTINDIIFFFPTDNTDRNFPSSLLYLQLNNGEKVLQYWLVRINEKQ